MNGLLEVEVEGEAAAPSACPPGGPLSPSSSAQHSGCTVHQSVGARSAVGPRASMAGPASSTSQRPNTPPTLVNWSCPAVMATCNASLIPAEATGSSEEESPKVPSSDTGTFYEEVLSEGESRVGNDVREMAGKRRRSTDTSEPKGVFAIDASILMPTRQLRPHYRVIIEERFEPFRNRPVGRMPHRP